VRKKPPFSCKRGCTFNKPERARHGERVYGQAGVSSTVKIGFGLIVAAPAALDLNRDLPAPAAG
jgi:hypothetical protein